MATTRQGAFRLFRFADIDVFVHWTWLLVAWYELAYRRNDYQSPFWNVLEYLSVFAIVTVHEFGHALACRQVGGLANQIMLWPLGGVAFVQPPPRPGALLWSILAGPLVNVLLVPITIGAYVAAQRAGLDQTAPDASRYVFMMAWINGLLLLFNMLPIYPLDGGQALQAVLWFAIGRAWSLLVVSSIGLVVGALLVVVCLVSGNIWLAILSFFIASRGLVGFRQGQTLARLMRAPRHTQFACPACGMSPPAGDYWTCGRCHTRFDTFAQQGHCPGCGGESLPTQCVHCHARHPLAQWLTGQRPAGGPVVEASLLERAPSDGNPYASPHDSG
ncbi:MAG TPA: site-2 protease family protein [Pirellulales bacterium]|jgi:Zn-dependent protease|nr:site-2 protease family protein [Pirellulales bacterium]